MGPSERAVQQAFDSALVDNRASALSRAGLGDHIDDREALRMCLNLVTGLIEATRALAIAVDEIQAGNDERGVPPKWNAPHSAWTNRTS